MKPDVTFGLKWSVIEEFYPASIILDANMNVIDAASSLKRHVPSMQGGASLLDLFTWDNRRIEQPLADLVNTGTVIDLVSNDHPIRVRGTLVTSDHGYLIIARHLPNPFELGTSNLRMSDFSPNDPIVSAMLLVGVQKAMLEEAQQAATELGHARQKSAEILQRFGRVAGFMAHDFNNLLSIIRLNMERLLKDRSLTERNKRLSKIIHDTTIRGSEISRSLMTLSSQRYDSSLPVQIDELIKGNFAFLKSIAGGRVSVSVSLNAKDALIHTSREGILNCLVNLVINARDAMPDGGDIVISTDLKMLGGPDKDPRQSDDLQEYIVIAVRDNGLGMSPDVASRAFEPLFSTKQNGNGIGLASVLDFTREMGGYSRIETDPSEGTCVFMKLPKCVHGSQTNFDIAEGEIQENTSNLPPVLTGLSVLLVEDEPYALEALNEMLEAWGIKVRPCSGVGQALAALREGGGAHFDLLLSDIVMADGNGIDLAEMACDESPEMEIILMSGFVPSSEKMRPTWQYLRKPIESAILREKILAASRKSEISV